MQRVMEILARNKKTAMVVLVAALLIVLIYFAIKGFQKPKEESK